MSKQVRKSTRDFPQQFRAAAVSTVAEDARTVELVWSTGAKVRRFDWWTGRKYDEELVMEPGAIRMGRLNGGAPLLDTHNQYQLDAVIGVVEKAWLDGAEGRAVVRFAKTERGEVAFQQVKDGIVRNVSVGYQVHRYEKIDPPEDGGVDTWRAIDWEPCELSLVPVPADAGAGTRGADGQVKFPEGTRTNACEFLEVVPPTADAETPEVNNRKEQDMKDKNLAPAANPAAVADDQTRNAPAPTPAPVAQPAADEATRAMFADILRSGTALGVPADAIANIAGEVRTLDEAKARFADYLAEKQARINPVNNRPSIETVRAEADTRRAAMAEAIQHRANPQKYKLTDAGRQYRGLRLVDIGRECIEANGGNARGLTPREIAVVALGLDADLVSRAGAGQMATTDFTNILASTVNRTLRAGYEQYPRTFTPWTREAIAPDFRQMSRVMMSELTAFKSVNEGGEYKRLAFGDGAEKYSLGKYGGIVAFTWEAMVNDDLGAFDRIPTLIGAEAAATESDVVYAILSANANMADGTALFHANHGNLPTAAAITDASLGLARAAMRKQTGPQGRVLNLTPDFLIVGPDKEAEANKYTSASFVAAKASDINPNFNTSLTVIVEPRVSGNKWYLSATPARVDTIEYAHLEGENGVYTERRQGWEVDGMEIKARLAFAAKAIDWRGLQYNSGA